MKFKTVEITSKTHALINTATVEGSKVVWDSYNHVEFTIKNGVLNLNRATADMSFETVFLSTNWKDFNQEQRDLIIAGALMLGFSTFRIADQVVTIAVTGARETNETEQKPATDWELAQRYTLSQHRKEPATRTIEHHTEVKLELKGKKAWFAAAGLGLVALGLTVLANR